MKKIINNIIDFIKIFFLLMLPVITQSVMSNAPYTFGHISCAIFTGSIFAYVKYFFNKPSEDAFFSITNMIQDPLRTSHTFGQYNHPLLNKTYFNRYEMMDDLLKLAKHLDQNPTDLYSTFSNEQNIAQFIYNSEKQSQKKALVEQYKKEKYDHSFIKLLIFPIIYLLFGLLIGIILNQLFFHLENIFVNIIISAIGIIILILFFVKSFSYVGRVS